LCCGFMKLSAFSDVFLESTCSVRKVLPAPIFEGNHTAWSIAIK
jgi:hypothetical protein